MLRLPLAAAAAIVLLSLAAAPAQARVVYGKGPAHASGFIGGSYDVGGGLRVRISASDRLPDPRAEARSWAAFFASLVHGTEIGRIRVLVMPVSEMAAYCGEGADGCYDGYAERLVIPPTTYANGRLVAAHEYGHHVANNRRNTPWAAVDWGTKRWATYEKVCPRARAGTAFPGDQGRGYSRNPGEAFAEAFAVLNGFEWESDIYSDTFKPDARALALIRQDVVRPWRAPSRLRRSGLLPRSVTSTRWSLPTPLDGTLSVTAASGAALDVDLELYSAAGRLLRRSATDSHRETTSFTVCGARRFNARVIRYRGAGRYTVDAAVP